MRLKRDYNCAVRSPIFSGPQGRSPKATFSCIWNAGVVVAKGSLRPTEHATWWLGIGAGAPARSSSADQKTLTRVQVGPEWRKTSQESIRVDWLLPRPGTSHPHNLLAFSDLLLLVMLSLLLCCYLFFPTPLLFEPFHHCPERSLWFTFSRQHPHVLAFIPFILCFSPSYLMNRRCNCCIALRSTQLRTIVDRAQR